MNSKGFSILIVIVVAAAVTGTGILFYGHTQKTEKDPKNQAPVTAKGDISSSPIASPRREIQSPTPTPQQTSQSTQAPSSSQIVRWDYDMTENQWEPKGKTPACPPLEFESPVNINKATSILYPGQYRGEDGNYRAHGGVRFDNQSTTDVDVVVPFDGYVWRGTRYLVKGTIQYSFDIVNSCGIMHRLGHLLELSPKFQKLADKFPQPKEGDSRTTETEPIIVKKGELVATKIGLPGNVFLDWGAYDLRQQNEASQNPAYKSEHAWQGQFVYYALCWLDYIPSSQQSIAKSLPGGDYKVEKSSDYCK